MAGRDAVRDGDCLSRLDRGRLGFGLRNVDIGSDRAGQVHSRWLVVNAAAVGKVGAPGCSWGTGGA